MSALPNYFRITALLRTLRYGLAIVLLFMAPSVWAQLPVL